LNLLLKLIGQFHYLSGLFVVHNLLLVLMVFQTMMLLNLLMPEVLS
jgi:hypothetical protein